MLSFTINTFEEHSMRTYTHISIGQTLLLPCPYLFKHSIVQYLRQHLSNPLGVLTQLDAPGHFKQRLYFFGIPGPSVDYNVIWLVAQ